MIVLQIPVAAETWNVGKRWHSRIAKNHFRTKFAPAKFRVFRMVAVWATASRSHAPADFADFAKNYFHAAALFGNYFGSRSKSKDAARYIEQLSDERRYSKWRRRLRKFADD